MKKFTKILSMVLLVAMCMSTFAGSAFATGDVADPAAATHTCDPAALVYHKANAADCTAAGNVAYYTCPGCELIRIEGGTVVTLADTVIPAAHTLTDVAEVEESCVNEGTMAHQFCTVCEKTFIDGTEVGEADLVIAKSTEHNWSTTDFVVIKEATVGAAGEKRAKCSVVGCTALGDPIETPALEEAPTVFSVVQSNGGSSYTYSSSSDYYSYQANKTVDKVTADGTEIEFSYTTDNEVFIRGSQIADINKSQIALVFYSGTETSSGLFISKPDKLEVEELEVNGLTQNKYVKGSGTIVSFQTTDPNPDNVKVFNLKTQTDTLAVGNTFSTAYYDVYTYTFTTNFLENLECGTYEIRCYYGSSNLEYKTPGTLMISDPGTTVDDVLYFTNGTQGNTDEYKYVSGDEVPRIYCPLFTISGANLQISTNGGKSWSSVNVHNYYIEQSNGEDTAYAWIKDTYLDSLSADTIYYFRVVVPAASLSSGYTDAVSNVIYLTTGPTLKAVDTAKHVINSTKNLRFTCSDVISKVYVGNVELTDSDDFAISNNGKTVTLSPDFLNARTAGSTYTIKVLTKSGEYASTTFQILTTAQASASPRTGDDSNIGLWAAFLLISGAAAVAVLPRLKKD